MENGIMDPKTILNVELIEKAFDIAVPSILEMFRANEPATVWGPRYIVIVVMHPNLGKRMAARRIDETTTWLDEWGDRDKYLRIAEWKAKTAQETGMPTSQLTLQCPWDHKEGDYLYPGGVVAGKLAVGASGVKGFADEGSAYTVLYWIEALCKLKREQLRESGVGQLG
jgi:hypothetical protein